MTPSSPRNEKGGLVLTCLLLGCSPGPRVGPRIDSGVPGDEAALTFTRLSDELLSPTCAVSGCHAGSPPPRAPMSLEAGEAYDALVGAESFELPSMLRVEPGAPEQSYLVLKLRGLAASAGGVGTRMPLGGTQVDTSYVDAIEGWIRRGAPDD